MGFLQTDRWDAARDATALLSVALHGQRAIRLSPCSDLSGRASSQCVHAQGPGHLVPSSGLPSTSRPKMDNCGLSLLEGARHNHCKEDRDGQHLKARLLRQVSVGGRPKSKAAAQKERQGRSRRSFSEDGKRGSLTSRGISAGCKSELNVGLESNPLQLSMTLSRWMACLPRWILKTRTKLACCLRHSFAIVRRSSETSSTVFPLPLASSDCFASSGPGLSLRRWTSLCLTPVVNMWIWVLDFCIYLSPWPTCDELRRTPILKSSQKCLLT